MDTLGRLDRSCAGFRRRLVHLRDGDLARSTPCEGWTVADLVEHTTSTLRFAAGAAANGRDAAPAAEALLSDFDAAVAGLRDRVLDPELAAAQLDTPFGRLALKQLVSSVVVHDVLVHTWDLARATGQDEALDAELVEHTLQTMTPFDAALRGHGFAEKVPAPPGADPQTELLCFLGRRP